MAAGEKEKLADLTLETHIFAYLIAVVIFVSKNPVQLDNLFSSTIKFIGVLLPAAAFILLDVYFLHRSGRERAVLIWNVVKHLALLVLITLVFFRNDRDMTASGLYLLPVVLSCLTLGRGWGMAFAAAATGCLVVMNGVLPPTAPRGFELSLIFGGLFFLAAWFGASSKLKRRQQRGWPGWPLKTA